MDFTCVGDNRGSKFSFYLLFSIFISILLLLFFKSRGNDSVIATECYRDKLKEKDLRMGENIVTDNGRGQRNP